ncbi:MAG: hypothetical protein K2H40_04155 [Lachnospiraceae bacterium]|nr:hypothetical protein [Lachnospiraceae bacterium]
MARTADYSNTQKYSNKKSFDGKPVEPGKVLVPFRQDVMQLRKEDCIDENFAIIHLSGIKFKIGFMAINESCYASYMKEFWKSINDELATRRTGRCIIGHNPDGTDIFCPHSRRCKECPEKGKYDCRNPNYVDILSLNYEFENEEFDVEDTNLTPVADQVINILEPEISVDELFDVVISHFEKKNPRYAQIFRLSREKMSIEDICVTIGLKPNRGRQEINNAYDALCDFLKLSYYKKNRK